MPVEQPVLDTNYKHLKIIMRERERERDSVLIFSRLCAVKQNPNEGETLSFGEEKNTPSGKVQNAQNQLLVQQPQHPSLRPLCRSDDRCPSLQRLHVFITRYFSRSWTVDARPLLLYEQRHIRCSQHKLQKILRAPRLLPETPQITWRRGAIWFCACRVH